MSERPGEPVSLHAPVQTDRLITLFDRHADRLYRMARRLAASADDALDLVQETFLRAAGSPEAVPHGVSDEEAWLVRVLVNIRRDQWRKERVRRRHEPHLLQAAAQQGNPERIYVVRETVWRALDHLAPRRRAVLVMHELEGMSVPAIAQMLSINAITVRWHLARARRELARRIQDGTGATDEQPLASFVGGRPTSSRSAAR